ncbi:MAG: hydantoinase B/oxoprolinase family protein [Microthrixaceae bacterium]|nr:hydantoinase B/oxoprolinase family protein [Microthrixaceae bacterium]
MTELKLAEQLKANDKVFTKSGHLFGLDEMKRKEENPGDYEALWHILSNMCNIAWEVGCKVSSSPIAVEGGDALWALHLPTGEAVCISRGITAHPGLLADMIRKFIDLGYEESPGFAQGDIFENNDPHYGGIHAPDFDTAMPIFYDGKLIAWASCVTHVSDSGSVTPGSVGFLNPDCYSDGVPVSMEKVGQDDAYYPWYEMRIRSRTRTPDFVLGDAKGRLAGCITIRERLMEVIEKYGIDFYLDSVHEFVEDSRRYAVGRVKTQTVPGRMRKSQFKDLAMKGKNVILNKQDVDCLMALPMELEIDGDANIRFSLRGASGSVPFGENIHPTALKSGLLNGYSHVIGFDMFNSGPAASWDVELPPSGSWANPFDVDWSASSGVAWAPRGAVDQQPLRGLRPVVPHAGLHRGDGGRLRHHDDRRVRRHDTARLLPRRAHPRAGQQRLARTWLQRRREQRLVHLHAQRRLRQRRGDRALLSDSLPGSEHRGRLGWLRPVPRRARTHRGVDGAQHALGDRVPVRRRRHAQQGAREPRDVRGVSERTRLRQLRGRYQREAVDRGGQASRARSGTCRRSHARPQRVRDGDRKPCDAAIPDPGASPELRPDDPHRLGWSGDGDPIDRDPVSIEDDLNKGWTLPKVAADINGAVVSENGSFAVDTRATEARRTEIREKRKQRAVPFREWWTAEREKVAAKENMDPAVLEMWRSSMSLSPDFGAELRAFWGLPDDFEF